MDELACSTSHKVDCTSDPVTSPRYWGYVLAAFVVGLAVISPMAFLLPLEHGLWTYARWDLGGQQVNRVVVETAGMNQVQLEGPAAGAAAEAFLQASYCQSNRDGQGPEPRARLSFAFAEGKTVRADMWPDGRFEVTGLGRSYLVSSPSLTRLVQESLVAAR